MASIRPSAAGFLPPASPAGPVIYDGGVMKKGLLAAIFLVGMAATEASMASKLPEPAWNKLPRWRGFNLLGLFYKGDWSEGGFKESDFQWLSELGFNFVRLPMDYRYWIKDGDWRKFDETTLQKIDQAVEWGRKYNIHVLINFHRAPGYTVAQPSEVKSLWTDPEVQEVCALHWATFARRYKGIPSRNLSFNLFNEPSGTDPKTHAKVVKIMVDAIRKEDPDRLVICDSLNYGNTPSGELLPLKVGIATRGYSPFQLTHYKASWVGDNSGWPQPTWPIMRGMNMFLYANDEPDSGKNRSPLILKCALKNETVIAVKVHAVTSAATLAVSVDGKRVLEKSFKAGPGEGEWKESKHLDEWDIDQCIYDKDYTAKLPAGTREIRVENVAGDWMTISEVRLKPFPGAPGDEAVIKVTNADWGAKQGTFVVGPDGRATVEGASAIEADRETLWRNNIMPFKALEDKGIGIFVGEWGSFNSTPHDVVMRWAEDCLANWKRAGWGWAMWEFRGSFGIIDSERSDVKYEDFHGHKLDRALLDLLQRY